MERELRGIGLVVENSSGTDKVMIVGDFCNMERTRIFIGL